MLEMQSEAAEHWGYCSLHRVELREPHRLLSSLPQDLATLSRVAVHDVDEENHHLIRQKISTHNP